MGNVIRKRVIVRDGRDVVADTEVDIEYRNKTVRQMLAEIESLLATKKVRKFMFTITDETGSVTELDFTQDMLDAKIDPMTTNPKIQQLLRSSSIIIMELQNTVVSLLIWIALILLLVSAFVFVGIALTKRRNTGESIKSKKRSQRIT